MIRGHTAALCALALGAVFAVGGCGGDDDGDEESASGPKTSTETQPRRGFEAGTVGVVTSRNFNAEVLDSPKPVLVSLIGPDCCQSNNAYLKQLAGQRDDLRIVTIDVGPARYPRSPTAEQSENAKLAKRFGMSGSPSDNYLIKGRKKVVYIPGEMTEGHFKSKIEPQLR